MFKQNCAQFPIWTSNNFRRICSVFIHLYYNDKNRRTSNSSKFESARNRHSWLCPFFPCVRITKISWDFLKIGTFSRKLTVIRKRKCVVAIDSDCAISPNPQTVKFIMEFVWEKKTGTMDLFRCDHLRVIVSGVLTRYRRLRNISPSSHAYSESFIVSDFWMRCLLRCHYFIILLFEIVMIVNCCTIWIRMHNFDHLISTRFYRVNEFRFYQVAW